MESIAKEAKIIGIGEEGIKALDSMHDKVKENMDIEKITIKQDVDKEYVRQLLDGVEVLFLTYSTEDNRVKEIVKAISYMASERRVLCIGLNTSDKENKDELGVNREFNLANNLQKIVSLVNLMIESISDNCMINIDVTDLKEVLASDKGIKYSYEEFDNIKDSDKIANTILNNMESIGAEFIGKKGIVFVELNKSNCEENEMLIYLNEVLTKIQEDNDNTYELIFSLYVKEDLNGLSKVALAYN